MRVIFLGATPLAVKTARALLDAGNEVVIIERNEERIKELHGQLDCAFLHGDGSRPDLLKQADPERTDVLYCITNHDQTNIIASLIARNLKVRRIVTLIEDEDFVPICRELGLEDTMIPLLTISRHLVRMTEAK